MSLAPLSGRGVLITRPEPQALEFTRAVEQAGGTAIVFPVLEIQPRDRQVVEREQASLPAPDIAVFVSRNAVLYGLDLIADESVRIAAIGPATRAAIEAAGRQVDIWPARGFDTEHLLREPSMQEVQGKAVVIVRADRGRELLGSTLRERGARVDYLSVYRRLPRRVPESELGDLERRWLAGDIDCVSVMSVDSLDSLLSILPASCVAALPASPLVTPSGRVIQTAVRKIPGIQAILAPGPQAGDMVRAIITALGKTA